MDCRISLSTLYHVLLTICVAMAAFTPFFTESLYQNLRKVSHNLEESIHYCNFPSASGVREERIEQSVTRMMTVIDLARSIRQRRNKPLKTPIKEMIVVHPDAGFLEDVAEKLNEYVMEELNVNLVVPCNDPLKYASLRAKLDFSAFVKRPGDSTDTDSKEVKVMSQSGIKLRESIGTVSKEVKAMSQSDILAFQKSGEVTFSGHSLKLADIKVVREFKRPANVSDKEMDAAGDGDVLVILDLRADESLFDAGIAREIVHRIQILRKKVGLAPTDIVQVYYETLDKASSNNMECVVKSQDKYIKDALGVPLIHRNMAPDHDEVLGSEQHKVTGISFSIHMARTVITST